jgi:hypothetical protein
MWAKRKIIRKQIVIYDTAFLREGGHYWKTYQEIEELLTNYMVQPLAWKLRLLNKSRYSSL